MPRTGAPGAVRVAPGVGEPPGARWAPGVGEPPGFRPGLGNGATEGGLGGGVGGPPGARAAPGAGATLGGRCIMTVGDGEASSTSTTGMSSSRDTPRFGADGGPAGGFSPTPIPAQSNFGVGELVVGMRRCAGGVGEAALSLPGAGLTGAAGFRIAGGVGVRGPSRISGSSSASKSNAEVSGFFCGGGGPGFRGGPGGFAEGSEFSGFGASLNE